MHSTDMESKNIDNSCREFKTMSDVGIKIPDDLTDKVKTEKLEYKAMKNEKEMCEDFKYSFEDYREESDESNQLKELSKAKQLMKPVRKRKALAKSDLASRQQKVSRCELMSIYQEQETLEYLRKNESEKILDSIPEVRRLCRSLVVRKLQRGSNIPCVEDRNREIYYQIYKETFEMKSLTKQQSGQTSVVQQVGYFDVIGHPDQEDSSLYTCLMGGHYYGKCFRSPYTLRILKPIIFQTCDILPPKLKLLLEIVAFAHRKNPSWQASPRTPIDFCYVRPWHIPVLNAYCKEFFWPGIDLSECLEYPDFSCVVLYRKAVVGFAFMLPDAKPNEAYITYIFTHPDWRNAGIGKFMLYHLFQTCMGKDVTLHVAIDNPAVLLYQWYGFKIESRIDHFYDKYLPPNSNGCRHAFFMRLSK